MSDLTERVARARDVIDSDWDDVRTERALGQLSRRRRNRTIRRVAGAGVLVGVAVILIQLLSLEDARTQLQRGIARAVVIPKPRLESTPRPTVRSEPSPPKPRRKVVIPRRSAVDWQTLADDGKIDEAYQALSKTPISIIETDVAMLLKAADVARLSRHPAQAIPYLSRVVNEHGSDPRAAMAAFTMGRVLLGELGRPREAAQAFAKTRNLAPSGSLSEDALAREVEAWSRAGETNTARARASLYVKQYPRGRRLNLVRRYGGLSDP